MKEFCVELSALACATASVYVHAATEEEAKQAAVEQAKAGQLSWYLGGIDQTSVEALAVMKVKQYANG